MAESLANLAKGDEVDVTRDWNDITTDVLSAGGYTAPNNMVCFVRGTIPANGLYYIYPMINNSVARVTFSGYGFVNYQVAHYFYLRKGDVLKQYGSTNINTVTYHAIQVD